MGAIARGRVNTLRLATASSSCSRRGTCRQKQGVTSQDNGRAFAEARAPSSLRATLGQQHGCSATSGLSMTCRRTGPTDRPEQRRRRRASFYRAQPFIAAVLGAHARVENRTAPAKTPAWDGSKVTSVESSAQLVDVLPHPEHSRPYALQQHVQSPRSRAYCPPGPAPAAARAPRRSPARVHAQRGRLGLRPRNRIHF